MPDDLKHMVPPTSQAMTGQHPYLAFWLSVCLVFYLLLAGSALTMWLKPQTFYWRAWEYFSDIVYRNQGVEPLWQGPETGDRSREFYFLYQQARTTRVSTDQDGFRSVPYASRAYPVAVLGDSTIFGSGLSDEETLPWRLALELGLPVFNGGRTDAANALARPELAQVKLVIAARTEAGLTGVKPGEDTPAAHYQPLRHGDAGILNSAPLALYFLPARVLRDAGRIGYDLAYWRQHRGELPPRLLKRHRYKPSSLETVAAAVESNYRIMQQRGVNFVFLPVPAAQTLYAPDVDDYTRSFIPRLVGRLRELGVPSLDLATPMQARKDEGLFLPTDTHWNEKGTAIASRELAAYLRQSGLLEGMPAQAAPGAARGN